MTRGARYGENFSPMSHGSQSLKSSADNCTWVQLKSNELKDRKDVSCSENFITQTTETNDTMIGGFSNIELRKDSGIQDDDFDSAPVDEIYPESKKTVKKNPCLLCFYSITRPKSVILMILIVSVVLLLVFFAFALLPLRSRRIPIIPLTSAPPTTLGTIRVLLLGDSVLGIPSRRSALEQKIAAFLPQYYMKIDVSGKLGVRLFVLRQRLDRILASEKADVIILYADSDLSNVNEDAMTVQEKYITRSFYRSNFTSVVESILKTKAHLAMSGPGLLGEAPLHQIPNPARFVNKDGMLDDYCRIARSVAAEHNVTYLDFRGELKKAIPWYRLWYAGFVTKDGEHTNERGTLVLAEMISKQLLLWFQTYNSTTHFSHYNNGTSKHVDYGLDDTTE